MRRFLAWLFVGEIREARDRAVKAEQKATRDGQRIAKQAVVIRRQADELATLQCIQSPRDPFDKRDGWERRARALWEIADPDLRDGVVSCLSTIERLPEVQS